MAWDALAFCALPAWRATPGDRLLPAGPGIGPRAEAPAGPRDAGQHAGRVRRCLPGRPVTCRPPSRHGSRRCRSSTTWDARLVGVHARLEQAGPPSPPG